VSQFAEVERRLVDALMQLGSAAGRVEEAFASLSSDRQAAVGASEKGMAEASGASEDVTRLRQENERLRQVLEDAQTAARRIRNRLALVEDEL